MAKKAISRLAKAESRSLAKVIKMVKSPKTGAYVFEEDMVHVDDIKAHIAK